MIINCTNCDKEFNKLLSEIKRSKSGNHFCSSNCSAVFNNTTRSRKDNRPDFTCLACGSVKKSKHNNQKYCSAKCQQHLKQKERDKLLEQGENLSAKLCKSYYVRKDAKCSCCALYQWNGKPIPLELDHIDGDGTNNTLSNTRLLCPNCHAQTSNYKSKNTDNPLGKDYRVKRYNKCLK